MSCLHERKKILFTEQIVRSTSKVLHLLNGNTANDNTASNTVNIDDYSKRPDLSTSSLPSSHQSPLKLFFNVVWGKRSTKKHKTFEGDGILTVSNKTATLRDTDGSYLGSTTLKTEEIEIGSRLIVGSNEIEIIEQSIGVQLPVKRKTDDDGDEDSKPKKKPKSNPSCFQPYLNLSNSVGRQSTLRMNFNLKDRKECNPLIMPEPTCEHQLKFNPSKRPVKEVSVIPCCARELRPHQREGVLFLYECLMGFRSLDHFGCILADEMGLGKTLQCISVCYTLLKQGPYGINVANRILVSKAGLPPTGPGPKGQRSGKPID